MTLKEFVLRWDNNWRFDFWWRQKYNIHFNSQEHRQVNQIDMKFEYLEQMLANQEYEQMKNDEEKLKKYKQTGQWLKLRDDSERQKKLFDMVDLKNF